MDASTILAIAAVAGLALNVILFVKSGAWGLADRLSEIKDEIMAAFATHKTDVEREFKRLEAKIEAAEHGFGETARATQTNIHEIEKWARDEFVRKGSFENVMSRIETSQATRDDRLEKRLDRLDAKLDELQARKH